MTRIEPRGLQTEIVRYLAVGGLNTAIGLAVILILRLGLGMDLMTANATGYAVGLAVSFIGNRNWTFGASSARLWYCVPAFVAVVGTSFAASMIVMSYLLTAGVSYVPSQLAGVATYSTIAFLGMKYLVFGN